MARLRVCITDDTCNADECIEIYLPLETMKGEIMGAVEVLYPTCTSLLIEVAEEE